MTLFLNKAIFRGHEDKDSTFIPRGHSSTHNFTFHVKKKGTFKKIFMWLFICAKWKDNGRTKKPSRQQEVDSRVSLPALNKEAHPLQTAQGKHTNGGPHTICLNVRVSHWPHGKEPTCQCRRHKKHGFNSWAGKISWNGKWQPTPVFLPGKFYWQWSLAGYNDC